MHIRLMMIMVSGPVLMNTYGDDNRLHEEEIVYTERGTMGDMGVVSIKTELCPTGGRDNILRLDKSADAVGDAPAPVDD